MSFRWRPSSWMQFSILRLKSSIARANRCWSIVSTSCRIASFNWFKLRGLWVYTRPFRYPQRKKSHDDKHVLWAPHFAFRRCAMAPRSPDLSSCDFLLWGYLKSRVYTHNRRCTMAPKVSWLVIVWFLPLGVLKGRVYTHNRRCAMAPKVSWLVIMWFLPLGVPEGPCVHSQSAMCHGPQGLLTCHHVISSSGGTWRAVCTLTNPVIWTGSYIYPSKRWQPVTQWHSITSQTTLNFQEHRCQNLFSNSEAISCHDV